jgi:hypothetical protein
MLFALLCISVASSGELRIFNDGVEVGNPGPAATGFTTNLGTDVFRIGADDSASNLLAGYVDEVAVFNSALTVSRMQNICESCRGCLVTGD